MCALFSHCRLTIGDPFPPLAVVLAPLVVLGGGWRICPLTACGWRARQLDGEVGQLVHGEAGATGECRRRCGFAGRGYLAAAWDRRRRSRLGRGRGRRREAHFPGCDPGHRTIQTTERTRDPRRQNAQRSVAALTYVRLVRRRHAGARSKRGAPARARGGPTSEPAITVSSTARLRPPPPSPLALPVLSAGAWGERATG